MSSLRYSFECSSTGFRNNNDAMSPRAKSYMYTVNRENRAQNIWYECRSTQSMTTTKGIIYTRLENSTKFSEQIVCKSGLMANCHKYHEVRSDCDLCGFGEELGVEMGALHGTSATPNTRCGSSSSSCSDAPYAV